MPPGIGFRRRESTRAAVGGREGGAEAKEADVAGAKEDTAETTEEAPEDKPTSFAFAFDIDGVLLRGDRAIPGAGAALRHLQLRRVPFIFLTNGGGRPERERLRQLVSRLGLDAAAERDETVLVQSHSPFRELARELGDKTVLVTG